ncbi:3-ketodihydrosphingosine reductase [Clarias magur]|uniref:3-ketodihydrosphingosine reductase n=1 Tax=Clarias magur TaxID=1594786 RepID=A0A8J4TS07_CLAMG|nr:3-ketodihydrosphingosine reductase [Clarias magur]
MCHEWEICNVVSQLSPCRHTHTVGFSMVGMGRMFGEDSIGGSLSWTRQVIPWWLMNGGTDGSFVLVMELAAALWEED